MRNRISQTLPLILAAALQIVPMLRSLIPVATQGLAPSTWAIVFRLATGATALFGYHAISSASSLTISPVNATKGSTYSGTVTFTDSHQASVSSMNITNVCGSSMTWTVMQPNITATYGAAGANKLAITSLGPVTNAGKFTFGVRAFNTSTCGGQSSKIDYISLTVIDPGAGSFAPTWSATPANLVVQAGADAILSGAASGNPTPGYYWDQGITHVAVGSSLSFTSVSFSQAGQYTLYATNFYSAATHTISSNCILSVVDTPSSLLLNYTNFLPKGINTNLSCTVSNVPNGGGYAVVNKYQWQLNGNSVFTSFGGQLQTLPVTNAGVSPFISGTYTVAVVSYQTNASTTNILVGSSTSAGLGFDSYWVFGDKPTITTQPLPQTNAPGSTATFSVVATGDSANLTPGQPTPDAYGRSMLGTNYQWYSNSVATPLAGQTASSLTLNSVSAASAGNYFVIVTNVFGAVTSSPVALTITASSIPPSITNQPISQIVPQGTTVNLSVTAGGTPSPTFQWKKSTSNLANGATGTGSTLSGCTTNTLVITSATTNDSGDYSVGITNSAGGTNSSSATLLVVAPATAGQSPVFTNSSGNLVSGNQFSFTFQQLAGYRYLLQRSTNLSSPIVWTTLTNIPPAFTGAPFNFYDTLSNPGSYYRAFMTNN